MRVVSLNGKLLHDKEVDRSCFFELLLLANFFATYRGHNYCFNSGLLHYSNH